MSPLDSGFPRDPGAKKRMLPSVTDVVRELAKVVSADPAVLFKAARSVVAEELAKVKQGFEAAPLDVLVRRARLQLERDGTGIPVSEPAPPTMPVFPARPAPAREAPASPPPSAKPAAADDPFQDLASRSDLNWEKDLPIQPEDAPFRSAILPIPRRSRGPLEISSPIEPVKDRVPAPAPLAYVPEPSSPSLPPPTVTPAPPAGAPPPLTYAPESEAPERKSPERAGPPPSRETQPGLTSDLFGELPTEPRMAPMDPVAPAAPAAPVTPAAPVVPAAAAVPAAPVVSAAPAVPAAPIDPKPLPRPTVASAPAIPLIHLRQAVPSEVPADPLPAATPAEIPSPSELEDNTQPAMEEFHFKAPDPPPARPVRSGGRGWLVAVALVLAVGAFLTWAVREYVFKNEIVKPAAPIVGKKLEEAPAATPAPQSIPTPAPAVAAKLATVSAKPAPALPKGKAALLLTPDWAGKPAIYVVHFSSTKDRESAAKDALRLGAALGAPARAVEVDLGEKGVWYRVVVGEFPDVDAARAFRADLEAKKTPGMGFVYEMRGR
ncbi:MAG: SPOR domain-containing protein [Thermoanaerobaculia bacterium]|nr:SPOR domain-containing protein [Thermoanaerobaculia bacterium]